MGKLPTSLRRSNQARISRAQARLAASSELDSIRNSKPTERGFFEQPANLIATFALLLSVVQFLNTYLSRNDGFNQVRMARQIEECLLIAEVAAEAENKIATLRVLKFWTDASPTGRSQTLVEEAKKIVGELKRLTVRARIIFPSSIQDKLVEIGNKSDEILFDQFWNRAESSPKIILETPNWMNVSILEESTTSLIKECNSLANREIKGLK